MARAGHYEPEAEYGLRDGQELYDVWGFTAVAGGTILVFDGGSSQVLELTPDLQLGRSFGRSGNGPGEIATSRQKMPHGDWIAANDTAIVILDIRRFSSFNFDGGFLSYPANKMAAPILIKRIALLSGRVTWVSDKIDPDGRRTLETWELDSAGSPALVRADRMPSLPVYQGRRVIGPVLGQADPLWTANDACLLITDGSGDWVLRVSRSGQRVDTLRLPPREAPPLSTDDEERLAAVRRRLAALGVTVNAKPTAPIKWQAMIVDPDGYLWLEPWRPESMRLEPLHAVIVNLANGRIDSTVVSRFPSAFLPGSAYVTAEEDTAQGVTVFRRYVLRSNAPPS